MYKRIWIFLLPLFFGLNTNAQIIPDKFRINWEPGIPGGIPTIESPVANILDFGADPKGTKDSYGAFVAAIQSLPATGGVVLIPSGTYLLQSTLRVERTGIVFRGEGQISRLISAAKGNSIEVANWKRGNWQPVRGGFNKDSLTVEITDGSVFKPGSFAEIEQDNDSLVMYTKLDWIQSWGNNAVGQMFEVTCVSGNKVTFKQPLNISFSEMLNVRIRTQGLVRDVGFEDFYIEKTVSEGHTFYFINSAYCWIRNIESYHTRKEHVNITSSLCLEIRDSYFHHSFSYGDGGSGYGVDCAFHATNCLVENNVFNKLRHAMMVHLGANGNVFGYNVSIYPVQGEGESNLNVGWIPPDISVHGHFPFMNLFEGNRIEELGIADYWGPSGPGNTFFRNNIVGEGIFFYDQSSNQNLIGNISTGWKDETGKNGGNLKHGNKIKGVVQWDPSISDHNLPASYYLDSVPAFFGGKTWPAFGPDVLVFVKIPAQARLEGILASGAEAAGDLFPRIFPNPVFSKLYISNAETITKVSLLAVTGEILLESNFYRRNQIEMNLYGIAPGLILVKVYEQQNAVKTYKVVKL